MRILVVILVLFVSWFSFGQINFYKQYSESGYDFGQGVVQLPDSSYVVTGSSSSFGDYQSQAFLLKVDSIGTVLWSNNYGGMESDWGRRVLYKEGFGFFIAGFTNSMGNGAYDFYLVKTDENGVEEWEMTYGDFGWEKVHDATLVRDSGVFMVGETSSNATDNQDIYIVRTDKDGNELWSDIIGGAGDDWATTVKVFQDSTFIVAGSTYVEDSLHTRGFFYNYHENGTLNWADTIHLPGNVEINDFIIWGDTIRAVGSHYHDNDSLDVMTFTYVISNGNRISLDTLNTDGDKTGECIATYDDPFPVLLAYNVTTNQTFPGGHDLNIGYYSSSMWFFGEAGKINHEGPDVAGQMISTSDGGVMLVGYTSSDGFGGGNIYLCKFGINHAFPTIIGVTAVYNFVGLEESNVAEFILYPNPASFEFAISTPYEGHAQVTVINILGEVLISGSLVSEGTFNISELCSGIYTVIVETENGLKQSRKLIVQ